jgi:uncharacterized protein YjdB
VKAPELTLTGPSSIELSVDGSSGSITFTANRDWTVSCSDSWVTVSPSKGEASKEPVTVTVRCNANTTYDDRTATVTIRMEELSQSVTVRQPANLGIVLPTQAYNLTSDARSIEVEVKANVDYTVEISADWIKQAKTKALMSKTLTFNIEENQTYDAREGKITIKSQNPSVPDQVISVKQAQKDAIIVKDTSFDMPYGGGEIEFKVEANVAFDVRTDADWLHYVSTKALSTSTVKIKVDENATFSARSGKVEVTQQGGSLKHTITVNQAGRIAVTSVELDKTELTLKPEETATLDATDKTVTWTSSEPEIATVDETGKVTAVKIGKATITAKAGEKTTECKVTVLIPVSSVELDKTTLELKPSETATLVATVKPDDATDKTVTWTSSDPEIATVDEVGKVTAIKLGVATITAKAGEKTAECKVTVCIPVTSVELNKTTLSLWVGDVETLIARVKPDNATDKTVTWTSSDPGIATVDEIGKVTAVKVGTATITAKAGDKNATCQVQASNYSYNGNSVDLGSIISTRADGTSYRLYWGDRNLGANTPEEYGFSFAWGETNTKSEYSWSNYKWANGASNKITKYCTDAGKEYWDGAGDPDGKSVLDPEDDAAYVLIGGRWRMPTRAEIYAMTNLCTGTMVSRKGVQGYEYKSKENNNTIFLPFTGYWEGIEHKDVSVRGFYWSDKIQNPQVPYTAPCLILNSSNAYVHDGVYRSHGYAIRPVFEGQNIYINSISLNETSLYLSEGSNSTLKATVKSSYNTVPVVWSSSDPTVATVDEYGKVTAIKEGTTKVAAKAGGRSATCDVVVSSIPPGAVDLGIVRTREDGTKYLLYWAECNIGASNPEEHGDYFAWGETEAKTKFDYSWSTYKWANGDNNKLTKYCPTDKTDYWDGTGSPDGKMVLDPEDDVAHVKLGGKWRMPTKAEWDALRSQCTLTRTTKNGVEGYTVKSKKNSNSIFLPADAYWSSSLHSSLPYGAYGFSFRDGTTGVYRYDLLRVRPVSE